jgi:hypothetical protein
MPLQINFEQEEIHDFLRVDLGVDDLIIDVLKESALVEAESFLNTDFSSTTVTTVTDANGVDTDTITITRNDAPGPVKLWVLQRMAQLYEMRQLGTLSFGKTYQKLDYTLLEPFRVYPFRG